MILTHLVMFGFMDGASGVAASAATEGVPGFPPWTFFDGFSDSGLTTPLTATFKPTYRPRRR